MCSDCGRFVTENGDSTENALSEVGQERERQYSKWGPQHHPDGTPGPEHKFFADVARRQCDMAAEKGAVTWTHILNEEFHEAMAESDPAGLRKELLQVAAVAVAWVEDLDSRPQYAEVHDLGGEG